MPWWAWTLLVLYVIVLLGAWRHLVWRIANSISIIHGTPEGSDIAFGLFVGGLLSTVWPLVLIALGIAKLYERNAQRILNFFKPRKRTANMPRVTPPKRRRNRR